MSAIAPYTVLDTESGTGVFEPKDRGGEDKIRTPFGGADSIVIYVHSTDNATYQIRIGPSRDIVKFPPDAVKTVSFVGADQNITEVTIAAPYIDINVTANSGDLEGVMWGTYTPGG